MLFPHPVLQSELTSLRDELRTLQRAKAELHDLLASKAEVRHRPRPHMLLGSP